MIKTTKIRDNYIFRSLYRRARSVSSSCVALYYNKVKGRKTNRLGITATKKIGGAVQRNRARRVILEAYRLLEEEIPCGYDYVIVARTRATTVKMQTVKAELSGLMRKIKKDNP